MAGTSPTAGISNATLGLLGLTCAVCVANNYYSQPLLIEIARDLGVSSSLAGLAPTLTQLGIAAGMLLLLPLGDRMDNRPITALLLAIQAAALAVMAASAHAAPYMAACLIAGICGIVTYLLPAYATRLVEPGRRGAVTGMLATGILTGIMLGRSMAGIAGFALGWRTVYGVAAAVTLAMALVMARIMPPTPDLRKERYLDLLRSLASLARHSPLLRRATLLQAISFGSFNALWVGLTLHLHEPPFNLDARSIGEIALVAVTSSLAAPVLGRAADRWPLSKTLRCAFALVASGWLAMVLLPRSYVGIVAGMVLIGIGAIGSDVSLRAALYGLAPDIRMRLNAVYSTGTFIGGGILSLLTPVIWSRLGWDALAIVGLGLSLLGFVLGRAVKRSDAEAPTSADPGGS